MVPAPTPDQYPKWIARAAEHYAGEIIIGDDLATISWFTVPIKDVS